MTFQVLDFGKNTITLKAFPSRDIMILHGGIDSMKLDWIGRGERRQKSAESRSRGECGETIVPL
jgi:hypothetical protein